ncbi:hypothetical protein M409DRAFT_20500 [Zasmidium cellare ATCC 36951]|uniref:Amine oxidase n=1 Tax=Zasmidium cellare ATCC 36951 TaxID=1080233 RepID=A0A6A6CQ50_ZASCE|nr:uncharacterized protein M409DRAFT_20500 [Zasmidium cellare ATCC 36951]KAF2169274.1 hypothetical protein M409DRAFT_20500 [Zasmidium cellare ATCC 36951]
MEPRSRSFIYLSSFLFFVAIATWFILPTNYHYDAYYATESKPSFSAPKQNVWAELTETEAQDIYDFVYAQRPELNLVRRPKSALENSIYILETLRPNKSDVVPYLFEDGDAPQRWAKAVLALNVDDTPSLVYHAVGPLPISKESQILPLTYPFNSGRNDVKSEIKDYQAIIEFGDALGQSISDITQELLGAATDPDSKDGLLCLPRPSRVATGGLVLWFQFFRPGLGSGGRTLLPQGVYVKVNATSLDQDDWTAGPYFYNGVIYDDVEDFRAAIKHANFKKTPPNLDGSWTDTEDFDAKTEGRELPPPISVQPYGPRYKLDKNERFVSWFGFEFYITTAQATGLTLYDIRFKGERVIYELGLQEAMAHYAGDDPMAGGQEFLDTFFGMGKNMYELLPGYDCPAYADYMDTHYHMAHETHELPNSICVFEYTADHLLSRHTAEFSVTASRNTYLIVRSTSTVGNYDYAIDYIFYMDGAVEVKVRASGYIFAAFYRSNKTEGEDEYGHRIGEAVSSSVHDHVINFKADLDVAGPTNDMVRLALEPLTKSYNWDQPEVKERNTMHLVEYGVNQETGLDWPKNSGEFFIVYNSEERNAWSQRRGYRITSGTGMGSTPHLTIENSTTLGDSARWAEHDIWVLRQKDTEPRSADPLNYLAPIDPIINFNDMADHESLEHGAPDTTYDGDLVVYFNLGSHHIPHSGDIPNTLMHTSGSSVMFIPHNFHDRDPSRESVQGVRLQLDGKKFGGGFRGQEEDDDARVDLRTRLNRRGEKDPKVNYFGGTYEEGVKVPLEALEPDLEKGYRTKRHEVTDLNFNGSAAGVWMVG